MFVREDAMSVTKFLIEKYIPTRRPRRVFTKEWVPKVSKVTVHLVAEPEKLQIPYIRMERLPLINGQIICRITTKSHFNTTGVLEDSGFRPRTDDLIMCIADGSGGCGAALARRYPGAKLYFNSLKEGGQGIGRGVDIETPVAYLNSDIDLTRLINKVIH